MTSPESPAVRLQVTLELHEAYALAELCKRISWSSCREHATGDIEAYHMIDATNLLRQALQDVGIVVR